MALNETLEQDFRDAIKIASPDSNGVSDTAKIKQLLEAHPEYANHTVGHSGMSLLYWAAGLGDSSLIDAIYATGRLNLRKEMHYCESRPKIEGSDRDYTREEETIRSLVSKNFQM